VIENFNNLLLLASTREERDQIARKIEQIEFEIDLRIRPFDKMNKTESRRALEKLDQKAFKSLR